MASEASAAGDTHQPIGRANVDLEQELAEAHRREAATAEVLKAISRSTFNLQDVLDSLIKSAVELTGAETGLIIRQDGEVYRPAAIYGASPEFIASAKENPIPHGRQSATGRAVFERRVVHIHDVFDDPEYTWVGQQTAGVRTILAVPMLKEDTVIGVIGCGRREVRPFTAQQIELVQTFADQAIIAIENARLFESEQRQKRELQEALDYQTATSEVLRVISSSPNELQPVLETILETAQRLCHSDRAQFFVLDNGKCRLAAHKGSDPEFVKFVKENPISTEIGTPSPTGKAARERRTIHVPDVAADAEVARWHLERGATGKSILAVPLIRGGVAIGVITLVQMTVRPFTPRQIELVSTFASQAVIAINNVDLFDEVQARTRELQKALEYQTATAEVLNVISRSPNQLQPVLDAIVATAGRLCRSEFATVYRLNVEDGKYWLAATNRIDAAILKILQQEPVVPGRGTIVGRAALEQRTVHMSDCLADPEFTWLEAQRAGKHRTMLAVPLMRDHAPIGVIVLSRTVVMPFSEKEIELIESFADQAVIAIENTRLFEQVQARTRELQEALEQQTATSEVLSVISSSPGELQPVFEAMLSNAVRICEAGFGVMWLCEGGGLRSVALHGAPPALVEVRQREPVVKFDPRTPVGRVINAKRTLRIDDLTADASYLEGNIRVVNLVERAGARSVVFAPMLREGEPIGVITIYRQEVRPFTDTHVDLVSNFAKQAVIAIENTRLLDELRESLEFQTATSEVLSVISRSKFDLKPVVDTIVETAARLCRADRGALMRFEPGGLRLLPTSRGRFDPLATGLANKLAPLVPINRGSIAGRVALEGRTVHVHDIQADPEYTLMRGAPGDDRRTGLGVPLISNSGPLGAIILQRTKVEPFTDKQIELVETFADQAVIAFENTRLFEEVQARNRDLTALGEVGRAVSSTLDLKAVLKTIVDRAVNLSNTDAGSIFYYHKATGSFELGETTGLDADVVAKFRKLDISAKETGLGEAITKRQPLQFADLTQRPSEPLLDAVLAAGFRASLIVPLLAAEGPLGTLILRRRQPGEFPQSVVSLMQAFADQSAIALENARLFEEIAQKSRELEIASQHKSQFVANMSHELRTPLAAMLGYAELLRDGMFGDLPEKATGIIERVQANGKHLLSLISTVLDISKIESGQFQLSLVEYSLDSMIETVRVATESLAAAKKLAFRTDAAKGLPYGLGDEPRLTQVLLNLVGNAIKFTDAGEVCISAAVKSGRFVVSVSDTGPGIPDEERERIFDKFHQVDSTSTKTKGGTGLGLAIAKEIIEMHGGHIWVESSVGRGSTFHMELPVRVQATGAAA